MNSDLLSLMRRAFLFPISPGSAIRSHRSSKSSSSLSTYPVDIEKMRNILVVKQDAIGDAILLIPFLKALRESVPSAHIRIVASGVTKKLWDECPYVDSRVYLTPKGIGLLNHYKNYIRSRRFASNNLADRDWDLALLPRWGVDTYYSSYIPLFCSAQNRIGFSESSSPEKTRWNKGYDKLLTKTISANEIKHETEQNLDIIREIGGRISDPALQIWRHEESDRVRCLKKKHTENLLIAFAPTARDARRVWPLSRFIAVAKEVQKKTEAMIAIVGGKDTIQSGNRILAESGISAINLAGKLDIIETIDFLKQCDVLVGNDSAPMHMACSAGIPVVGSETGGIGNLLSEKRGWLFPPQKISTLNKMLHEVRQCPEEAKRRAKRLKRHVLENHSLSKNAAKLIKIYNNVCVKELN